MKGAWVLQLALLLLASPLGCGAASSSDSAKELRDAAFAGDATQVEELLAAGADVHGTDDNSQTALHYVAGSGSEAVATALLRAGADVNQLDSNGWTALMITARYGHSALLQVLIDAGADLSIRSNIGRDALDLAKSKWKKDCIALLEAALAKKQDL
jgi:ankyrin repeat protein